MNNFAIWLTAALMAPILWSMNNVIDAGVRRRLVKNDLAMTWFASAMRLPIALVFIFMGGSNLPSLGGILSMLASGLLWSIPVFFYYKAIEKEEPSLIGLLFQTQPIFVLIIATPLLGEFLSAQQSMAFVLILIGSVLAAFKKTSKKWHFSSAFWLIMTSNVLWSFSDIFFKRHESLFSEFNSAFGFYILGSFFLSLIMLLPKKSRNEIKGHLMVAEKRAWVMMTASGLLGTIGALFFGYALTLKEASLTAVVMGVQPLFAVVFGLILSRWVREIKPESLKKEDLLPKGVALLIIMLGLYLL